MGEGSEIGTPGLDTGATEHVLGQHRLPQRQSGFLSHRLEHLSQARDTFQKVFQAHRTYGNVYEGQANAAADFVFATVQSAHGNPSLRARTFDYVVVDEVHHAILASVATT